MWRSPSPPRSPPPPLEAAAAAAAAPAMTAPEASAPGLCPVRVVLRIRGVRNTPHDARIPRPAHALSPAPLPTSTVPDPSTLAAFVGVRIESEQRLLLTRPPRHHRTYLSAEPGKRYHFDRIFPPTASQASVFATEVQPLVDAFLDGTNVSLFAYGQTSSGKTHTIAGDLDGAADAPGRGIVARALQHLFDRVDPQTATLQLSCIEIFCEQIQDLMPAAVSSHAAAGSALSPSAVPAPGAARKIRLLEDRDGTIVPSGVRSITVTSLTATRRLVTRALKRRVTATTGMHDQSSRSHAVLTLTLTQRLPASDPAAAAGAIVSRVSKLHIVDLAGSERLKRTAASGGRLQESVTINAGLLALGNVISVLSRRDYLQQQQQQYHLQQQQQQQMEPRPWGSPPPPPVLLDEAAHVPYRGSKLTRLLKNALGGNSLTLMIACIRDGTNDIEESMNTCKYATRARRVQNRRAPVLLVETPPPPPPVAAAADVAANDADADHEAAGVSIASEADVPPPRHTEAVEPWPPMSPTMLPIEEATAAAGRKAHAWTRQPSRGPDGFAVHPHHEDVNEHEHDHPRDVAAAAEPHHARLDAPRRYLGGGGATPPPPPPPPQLLAYEDGSDDGDEDRDGHAYDDLASDVRGSTVGIAPGSLIQSHMSPVRATGDPPSVPSAWAATAVAAADAEPHAPRDVMRRITQHQQQQDRIDVAPAAPWAAPLALTPPPPTTRQARGARADGYVSQGGYAAGADDDDDVDDDAERENADAMDARRFEARVIQKLRYLQSSRDPRLSDVDRSDAASSEASDAESETPAPLGLTTAPSASGADRLLVGADPPDDTETAADVRGPTGALAEAEPEPRDSPGFLHANMIAGWKEELRTKTTRAMNAERALNVALQELAEMRAAAAMAATATQATTSTASTAWQRGVGAVAVHVQTDWTADDLAALMEELQTTKQQRVELVRQAHRARKESERHVAAAVERAVRAETDAARAREAVHRLEAAVAQRDAQLARLQADLAKRHVAHDRVAQQLKAAQAAAAAAQKDAAAAHAQSRKAADQLAVVQRRAHVTRRGPASATGSAAVSATATAAASRHVSGSHPVSAGDDALPPTRVVSTAMQTEPDADADADAARTATAVLPPIMAAAPSAGGDDVHRAVDDDDGDDGNSDRSPAPPSGVHPLFHAYHELGGLQQATRARLQQLRIDLDALFTRQRSQPHGLLHPATARPGAGGVEDDGDDGMVDSDGEFDGDDRRAAAVHRATAGEIEAMSTLVAACEDAARDLEQLRAARRDLATFMAAAPNAEAAMGAAAGSSVSVAVQTAAPATVDRVAQTDGSAAPALETASDTNRPRSRASAGDGAAASLQREVAYYRARNTNLKDKLREIARLNALLADEMKAHHAAATRRYDATDAVDANAVDTNAAAGSDRSDASGDTDALRSRRGHRAGHVAVANPHAEQTVVAPHRAARHSGGGGDDENGGDGDGDDDGDDRAARQRTPRSRRSRRAPANRPAERPADGVSLMVPPPAPAPSRLRQPTAYDHAGAAAPPSRRIRRHETPRLLSAMDAAPSGASVAAPAPRQKSPGPRAKPLAALPPHGAVVLPPLFSAAGPLAALATSARAAEFHVAPAS